MQRTTIAASDCCMLFQRILRQEMTDLKVCYLLWGGEEICSNSGQSGRRFFFFSLSQWRGLSGPFVRIITWLLAASRPKIKLVVHRWEQHHIRWQPRMWMVTVGVDVCLDTPLLRPPLSLLAVSRAPPGYFGVVLSQLLYLWWQPLQAPQHSSFSLSGPCSW